MTTKIALLFGLLLSTQLGFAAPEKPVIKDIPGKNMQRTIKKMMDVQNDEVVRIVFYGQSITKQIVKETDFTEQFRAKFPNKKIEFVDAAIGGWQSQLLVKTKENEVPFFNADLIIFHCLKGLDGTYEETIRYMRSTTSAEILLWNDHLDQRGYVQEIQDRETMIASLAEKYDCGLVDVTSRWRIYLEKNNLNQKDLLRDYIHLNNQGKKFLVDSLLTAFVCDDALCADDAAEKSNALLEVIAGDLRTFEFNGIQLDAVYETSENSTPIVAKIDGQSPAELFTSYALKSPPLIPGFFQPITARVACETCPQEEIWTMTVSNVDLNAATFDFEINGNISGFEGRGNTKHDFVSNSKKIILSSKDWNTAQMNHKLSALKNGDELLFESAPLFDKNYTANSNQAIVVSALANKQHSVSIDVPPSISIKYFIVHKPWLYRELN